jgi:hypothetical protein
MPVTDIKLNVTNFEGTYLGFIFAAVGMLTPLGVITKVNLKSFVVTANGQESTLRASDYLPSIPYSYLSDEELKSFEIPNNLRVSDSKVTDEALRNLKDLDSSELISVIESLIARHDLLPTTDKSNVLTRKLGELTDEAKLTFIKKVLN